jgi:hypothetical protein
MRALRSRIVEPAMVEGWAGLGLYSDRHRSLALAAEIASAND